MNSYYVDSREFYVNDFARYLIEEYHYSYLDNIIYTDEELEEKFIYWLYQYKNIEINKINNFWQEVIQDSLQEIFRKELKEKRGNKDE